MHKHAGVMLQVQIEADESEETTCSIAFQSMMVCMTATGMTTRSAGAGREWLAFVMTVTRLVERQIHIEVGDSSSMRIWMVIATRKRVKVAVVTR